MKHYYLKTAAFFAVLLMSAASCPQVPFHSVTLYASAYNSSTDLEAYPRANWCKPIWDGYEEITGGRIFGASRSGRSHAGIDYVCPVGTSVYTMEAGTVIARSEDFYGGTKAIAIQHADGSVARYCEIESGLAVGDYIDKGIEFGWVIANNKEGGHMLHLELYLGTDSGDLTRPDNYEYWYLDDGKYYKRRADLIDPTFTQYLGENPELDDKELNIPYPRPHDVVLKRGSRGPYVGWLQTALDRLGYDIGSAGIDLIIGNCGEEATRQFQCDYGLDIDGMAGNQTIGKLVEVLRRFSHKPSYSILKADQTAINPGDTIHFTAESDIATGYTIGIDKDGERIITENMTDGRFSRQFNETGSYSAYVTSYNSAGLCDSDRISFTVSDPIPHGSVMESGYGRSIPDGDYYIYSRLGNGEYYLDIEGTDVPAKKETNVSIYHTSNGSTPPLHECWTLHYEGNGFYTIRQKNAPSVCLDVYNAGTAKGTNVQVYDAHGGMAQLWSIEPNSAGSYRIRAKASGYALAVYSGIAENGRNIALLENNDTHAEQWEFHALADKPAVSILSMNKESIFAGETITFTAESDVADGYTIGIEKDGKLILTQDMTGGTLSLEFNETGEYTAYVTSYNVSGSCDSEHIAFTVKPYDIILSLDGEDQHQIVCAESGLRYKSNNEDAVIVSNSGMIYAVGAGEAIVSLIDADYNVRQIHVIVLKHQQTEPVSNVMRGDVNEDGIVSVGDAVLLSRIAAEDSTAEVSAAGIANADVTNDGVVDMDDLIILLKYIVKLIEL